MESNNKPTVVYILSIILIFLILFVILILIIRKFNTSIINTGAKSYSVLSPIKGNGANMDYCPPKCVRGQCNTSKVVNKGIESEDSSNKCKYDFQCQYCQDKKTNMFYVNFDKEREILPIYAEEEEHKLTYNQELRLNNDIKTNNKYIGELNKKIKLMNS